MNLADYIRSHDAYRNMTQLELASALGVSRPYLAQLISGVKRPSLEVAVKIERFSGGAVPASIWVRVEAKARNSRLCVAGRSA